VSPTAQPEPSDHIAGLSRRAADLQHAIDHAAHLLPAQGPIPVFIHHNTLHAFEDLPFTDAVVAAARVFGCQPFAGKDWYRDAMLRGRIRSADLEAVLRSDLGPRADEPVILNCTRFELQLAMLQYPIRFGPTAELLWFVAETDALRKVRGDAPPAARTRLIGETRRWVLRSGDAAARRNLAGLIERFGESRMERWGEAAWEVLALQALWRICCRGVAGVPPFTTPPPSPVRHRDWLLLAGGADIDLTVHEVLIPFCAAFLDQGLANWQLPDRNEGFYDSFLALHALPGGSPAGWRRQLTRELDRIRRAGLGPVGCVFESLELLGVEPGEWSEFISATLLALRGWAGMIRFLEERPDRAVHAVPQDSLLEFLAVRLVLERVALGHAARDADFRGPLCSLRDELTARVEPYRPPTVEQRAFPIFQLAQLLGWTPEELHRLDPAAWAELLREVETFSPVERRRTHHLAYERHFYTRTLDAIALHNRVPPRRPPAPLFQAMFCIDDREESLRRHVEELAPDSETFGLAGFYFVSMYYRGATDAHFVPLCPAVVVPKHWVTENVDEAETSTYRRRRKARRALGQASHRVHLGSRSFATGAVLSAVGGVLATVPLVARTLYPRLTSRIRRAFGRIVLDPPRTRLQLERTEPWPGSQPGRVGFDLDEMTDMAERVLRDTGLTSNFARLVLTLGHGSTSMNNPHESAYDCGACGGSRGGPNGRAMAQVLNDPRVRERLKTRGLTVPVGTVFVGGMHNTGNDTVTFYDLDRLPESHRGEFEKIRAIVEEACGRDAHERCRRFESAPLDLSFEGARQHVEGRSEDLAQPRAELGHATNAICFVGRRKRTRGLFLDRRAFLNSYDPTQDDAEATILTRILQTATPVCAGINLEYYFSFVDNAGYGCGSKLPHNITSLLGVMDGAGSDLRTGLPWQMVEIHEPVRLLFVVENTPEVLTQILKKNPGIATMVKNGWVHLATLDPASPAIHFFRNGAFEVYHPLAEELPRASSSLDWYRGRREHLDFAEIGAEA
jgi:uncharacterized protein YbcC (UPF0753/DUF2309 family)